MGTLIQDVRYAIRLLKKSPGFAAVAILTLALGIGANTAIFSIVNGVLLTPLAFQEPQQLYLVREIDPQFSKFYPSFPANFPSFLIWQRECRSFQQIALAGSISMDLTGAGDSREISGAKASANLFDVLGIRPDLGRLFRPEEAQPGHDRVVILTNSFWRSQFNGDPQIVGKSVRLDGNSYEIVGVLPASFHFPKEEGLGALTQFGAHTEFFKPLGMDPVGVGLVGDFDFAAIARLKPGVTREAALAELNVVQAQISKQSGEDVTLRADLIPLETQVIGPARRGLLLLLGAVGAVMLIVCVNLVNLLLARMPGRMREAAVRSALGATRARLVKQMLTETLLLSVAGGLAGVALAYYGLRWLVDAAPIGLPRLDEVRVDSRALWFAFSLSVFTGALFGILPAWRLARADAQQALKSSGTRTTEGRGSLRMRETLIGFEVGLSTVLLILAGLLTTSLVRVLRIEKGFASENVLAISVKLPPQSYSEPAARMRFFNEVLAETQKHPGIKAAGWVSQLPLKGETSVSLIGEEGDARPVTELPLANYRYISPGYLDAMGIPIRQGRQFEKNEDGGKLALVSESLAARLWPSQNPIGKRIVATSGEHTIDEVIGVVGDIRTVRLDEPPVLMVYLPDWQRSRSSASLVIRSTITSSALATSIRDVIQKTDGSVPIVEILPMANLVSQSVAVRRFQMQLAGLFAVSALLLATLGIYGVVAYTVEQRTNEIGIRMALGAQAADVGRLVLRGGMTPVVVGLGAGITAAVVVGRLVRSLLYSVSTADPITISGVAIVIMIAAAFACYIPARRAMRVDPMVALRYE